MNRIAELRNRCNVTLETLAQELGISASILEQYETERRSLDSLTVVKASDIFGVSINYILGYPEQKQTTEHSIAEATRITEEYEENKINIYLSLGWKLLHVATEATSHEDGTMDSNICYVLGWYGDPTEAPMPPLKHPEDRVYDYDY